MLNDSELDKLLAHASTPPLPQDFQSRLLAKTGTSNVITLKRKTIWLIGLPLAASLAIGIWLGASENTSDLLSVTGGDVASVDANGFEDIVSIIEDDLT
jgi:membrane peptidoglycan carboxypeptidase